MLELLGWLLLLELLGLVAFPLTFRIFSGLPDRGWTFAKPLALLLLAYGVWLIGLSHTIPNSWLPVLLSLAVLVSLAWVAARRRWAELAGFVRREAPALAYSELVFGVVFLAWVVLRGYVPEISHTEQPMDFMFLNSVVISPHYPPNDPWLAGEPVSYYYFGYLMMGMPSLLLGVATPIAYNLALATTAAMAAMAAFGLVANLVRLSRGSALGAGLAGLGGAFLLVGASSLAGGLFILQTLGLGGKGFWDGVGIEGLTAPAGASGGWFPAGDGWWWWPVSRVIPGAITEFPQFSFLLGDLHPHVLSIPFLILAGALGVQLYVSPVLLTLTGLKRQWPLLLATSLVIGSLAAINLWDLPLGLAILAGAVALHAVRHSGEGRRGLPRQLAWGAWAALGAGALLVPVYWFLRDQGFTAWTLLLSEGVLIAVACLLAAGGYWLRAGAMAVCLALAALALFAPFYLTFESSTTGIIPLHGLQTRPVHLLLIWGVQGVLALTFLVAAGGRFPGVRGLRGDRLLVAAAIGFAPILLWLQPVWGALAYAGLGVAFATFRLVLHQLSVATGYPASLAWVLRLAAAAVVGVLVYCAFAHTGPEPGGAGPVLSRLLLVFPMALVVTLAIYGAWRLAQRPGSQATAGDGTPSSQANVSAAALGMLALAGTLVMGVELFHVADIFGGSLRRMNTVFKLYYQAWILLAIAGGYALYYIGARWELRRLTGRLGPGVLAFSLAALFAVVLYYPLASASSRVSAASGSFTFDGQAHLAAGAPGEYEVIRWVRERTPRDAIVLEAAVTPCAGNPLGCSDWTTAGRIAGSTGRPTILAWDQHERQWRSSPAALDGRLEDVREIYETTDAARAKELLARYDVRYVVVSRRERLAYGLEGMAKFASMGNAVFSSEATGQRNAIVYQVTP